MESNLNCDKEVIKLMHIFLDGDMSTEEESKLRRHLENCSDCQKYFHELKRTITLVKSVEHVEAPEDFTQKVMANLPTEKRRFKYTRWFKAHPILTAAAIFVVFMLGSLVSTWNQDTKLVVSKQDNLIIQGDTVIVPEGVTVKGDLVVKNGNLKIEGKVEGRVTLIKGKLIQADNDDSIDGEGLMASVGEVNGEFEKVDEVFEWIWFNVKNVFREIFVIE